MIRKVYAQARVLAGELTQEEDRLLELLCSSACSGLKQKLREGLTPEDCKADFVAGASLYALAALSECGDDAQQVKRGDVTVQKSGKNTAATCLRIQADLIMAPYVKDRFLFVRA